MRELGCCHSWSVLERGSAIQKEDEEEEVKGGGMGRMVAAAANAGERGGSDPSLFPTPQATVNQRDDDKDLYWLEKKNWLNEIDTHTLSFPSPSHLSRRSSSSRSLPCRNASKKEA
jgi:hypothetical protein